MIVLSARAPVYTDVVQSSAGVFLYSFPLWFFCLFVCYNYVFSVYMYERVCVPWYV